MFVRNWRHAEFIIYEVDNIVCTARSSELLITWARGIIDLHQKACWNCSIIQVCKSQTKHIFEEIGI